GWRLMEGFHCYNPATNCDDGTLTLPILEYDHSNGRCAVTGGYRYRGAAIPGLNGVYVYGDYCSGEFWGAQQASDGTWSTSLILDTSFNFSSFGEDAAGELYAANLAGAVYQLTPVPNPVPALTGVTPASVIAGDPGFTLTVNGSGFVYGSVVRWNGADRPTTRGSAGQLTAAISAADITTAGSAGVTVFTPAPGGGTSSAGTVDINPTFLDVPTDYFAYAYIQAVYNAGVAAGCGNRLYCPE